MDAHEGSSAQHLFTCMMCCRSIPKRMAHLCVWWGTRMGSCMTFSACKPLRLRHLNHAHAPKHLLRLCLNLGVYYAGLMLIVLCRLDIVGYPSSAKHIIFNGAHKVLQARVALGVNAIKMQAALSEQPMRLCCVLPQCLHARKSGYATQVTLSTEVLGAWRR